MSSSNSQGINTLLEAEREAAKIVQKARQYRVQKLKDARSEAAKEIEELKAQKNKEYQQFVEQHSGQSDQSLSVVDQDTDVKIEGIRAAATENRQAAIDKMLQAIVKVETKAHENARV
ncbi:G subunit of V-type ATPase [Pilobolus umbonatus]|nr:G subunit of V-type ATPase [Pilobolus umbonatus]